MKPLSVLLCLSMLWVSAVRTFAQEALASECPTIVVECAEVWTQDAPKLRVIINGNNPGRSLSYTWKVSGMKIVAGQGTPTITLGRPTLESHSFSAEVAVGGLPAACGNKAACGGVVEVLPKFGEFNLTRLKDADTHLKGFAARLKEAVGAQAYIIIYGNPSDARGRVDRLLARLKESLIEEYDIEPGRVVALNGGRRQRRSVELWVVPTGYSPPRPTPTVSLNELPTNVRRDLTTHSTRARDSSTAFIIFPDGVD